MRCSHFTGNERELFGKRLVGGQACDIVKFDGKKNWGLKPVGSMRRNCVIVDINALEQAGHGLVCDPADDQPDAIE